MSCAPAKACESKSIAHISKRKPDNNAQNKSRQPSYYSMHCPTQSPKTKTEKQTPLISQ
jgi:hypothetical protein